MTSPTRGWLTPGALVRKGEPDEEAAGGDAVPDLDPGLWGRGVGSELLSAWLRLVDADATPAYLETDAAGNIRFYERSGFEVVEEIRVLGVRIWTMRRPGAAGGRQDSVEKR